MNERDEGEAESNEGLTTNFNDQAHLAKHRIYNTTKTTLFTKTSMCSHVQLQKVMYNN